MLSLAAEAEILRVLVVDDDQLLLRSLADILRLRGYEPATAATGKAALLHVAQGELPAVALIDLILPDMGGLDVVRALRQISRSTEVVILTGNASLTTAVTALREHSYDYLVKPVAPEYLLQTIGKAGERWRRRLADERFEALLEAAPDAMVIVDEKGSIVLVNGQTEALFGYSRDEILGQQLALLVPEALRESRLRHGSTRTPGARAMAVGSAPPLALQARRKDGGAFPVEISLSPIHTAHGTLVSNAIRDVTARVRLEEQLRQAQKMEAIGRLAGGVAHDFNNILTAIIGYTDLAAGRSGMDAARQDLQEIRHAADRAASLTHQLLAFSRRQALKPILLDLSRTVSETAAMLRVMIGGDIALIIESDEPLGLVMADAGQLSQVVMNLAVNAKDAMQRGGTLRITTRNVEFAAGDDNAEVPAGRYVTVSVSDTGVGMDAKTLACIFEPFFTTKERGTGLGLATVFGIVSQSGGCIKVHSEPGAGTRFTVYLPRAAAARREGSGWLA
jgi:two-component system cell cycle sensor histidine kinase/response regulator CckA